MNELRKLGPDSRLDGATEAEVVRAVLDRIADDHSPDVQSIAVKTLGILVPRISDASLGASAARLVTVMITGNAELRDV
jgi:hypothetical protein